MDAAADAPPPPKAEAAAPVFEPSMLGTVCPQGGFHEWEQARRKRARNAAPTAARCATLRR
jgi:hypothetical protein